MIFVILLITVGPVVAICTPVVTLQTLHLLRVCGHVFRMIVTVETDYSCFLKEYLPGGLSNRHGLVLYELRTEVL